MESKNPKAEGPRVFHYQGTLPPALALLVIAPLLFVFLSFAALLVAGGAVAALVLPILFRSRLRRRQSEIDVITLDADQYTRVDRDQPRLPRH